MSTYESGRSFHQEQLHGYQWLDDEITQDHQGAVHFRQLILPYLEGGGSEAAYPSFVRKFFS
jgi:hypothetical protein